MKKEEREKKRRDLVDPLAYERVEVSCELECELGVVKVTHILVHPRLQHPQHLHPPLHRIRGRGPPCCVVAGGRERERRREKERKRERGREIGVKMTTIFSLLLLFLSHTS